MLIDRWEELVQEILSTPSPRQMESNPDSRAAAPANRLAMHFDQVVQMVFLPDKSDWTALSPKVPFLGTKKIQRLQEAFGTAVGWIVIENQYIDRDYRDTFSNTFSKRFATPSSRCQRLHFFSRELSEAESPDLNVCNERLQKFYLGYAVIRPIRPNGLGRTLVSPRIVSKITGCRLCLCREKVTLFGRELFISGFPFIGQDLDVTTCAQSSLWMIRRYYSNRYSVYAETHPHTLSKLAGLRFRDDRLLPATGLNDGQMAEMLRSMGFSPKVYLKEMFRHEGMETATGLEGPSLPPSSDHRIHFSEILLTYLDSGIPLVLSVKMPKMDHAVACVGFGDVSPSNRLLSELEMERGLLEPLSYRPGSVVINDDNYAPYLRIFAPSMSSGAPPHSYFEAPTFKGIESLIVPLPPQINILAEEFDLKVREIIKGKEVDDPFSVRSQSPLLREVFKKGKLALRCYLTSGRNFKQELVAGGRISNQMVVTAYQLMPLSHFIWVCELHDVTLPEGERCLGEIIWDSTCNREERQGLLALHYPELLVINSGSAFENRVSPDDEFEGWIKIKLLTEEKSGYCPAKANLTDI